jgi:lysine/ornithine N-monooxygenase
MWGLTIPTWGGVQNYAGVYLVRDKKLYSYINWTKEFSFINRVFREILGWTRGNPTHDLRFARNVDIDSQTGGHKESIVLCQNEQTSRALWEVGYMLQNMLLQAKSLGISFESKVFSPDEVSQLNQLGVPNAVAAVLI